MRSLLGIVNFSRCDLDSIMILLDGRALAAKIKEGVKNEIKKRGKTPGLVAILVGDDPASHLYVSLKEKACTEVGIHFEKYIFPDTTPQNDVVQKIKELNGRDDVHAILVQMPLPDGFNEDIVVRAIDPAKDVDGFHPENLSLLIEGKPVIIPGVALGIFELIKTAFNFSPSMEGENEKLRGGGRKLLVGKRAVILANSTTFALPIEYLLEMAGALPHIVLAPRDLTTIRTQLQSADILVTAIGRAHAITENMVKRGAVVIDVGTNRMPDGRVVGDVDFESVKEKAGALTPVPGGVGPMTVAMLLKNCLKLSNQKNETDHLR